jgi:hypothetical protein
VTLIIWTENTVPAYPSQNWRDHSRWAEAVATALCRRAGGMHAERLDTARRLQQRWTDIAAVLFLVFFFAIGDLEPRIWSTK